jgi:hypothetical protein
MAEATMFRFAADIILLLHVSFVLFIVVGLALIFVGKVRGWGWIRNLWFRIAHLLAIGVVTVQSWFNVICPLTTMEMALRSRAGVTTYPGAFISHWLEVILYYDAPAWAFALCYTVFAALVAGSWFWAHPQRFNELAKHSAT